MRLRRLSIVHLPVRRARFAGVGLAMLGAVGLGLALVPACGGGGATGENAVHLEGSAAHVALAATAAAAAASTSVAPDCTGGGGTGDN